MRQLLKLRVYTKDRDKYYSPMMMAMYILLNKSRVSRDLFITMIQMLNSYLIIKPSTFVKEFLNNNAQKLEREYVTFDEILCEPTTPMSKEGLEKHFITGKSKEEISVYREFYEYLVEFNEKQTKNT